MDGQRAFLPGQVALLGSLFAQRYALSKRYVQSLQSANLLQNYYMEAGLWAPCFRESRDVAHDCGDGIHWGWESPTSQLRGHFLGHWLSAAARIVATDGDPELKGQADFIVSELARCQRENGGEWAGSIPVKYLEWVARGKGVWAPHYTIHKTLMGLFDAYTYLGNEQALDVLLRWARWFHRWTGQFSRQQMDDILDNETGGMLEVWANLYGLTHQQEHLDLVYRYDRPRLFEPLRAGVDVLTNHHANTTIPEAQGAARAYEVTGDVRWREIVEAYWRCAVTERGTFCTGGQTYGESWTPPFAYASRLHETNQEHCTVYNMIRLADYLYRWTGDVTYVDYIERNLYNGILSQQHPRTGAINYYQGLQAGAVKHWGSPTNDFWCCHGSLVQAHSLHNALIYYQSGADLSVCQYIPSRLTWQREDTNVNVEQTWDTYTAPRNTTEPYRAAHADYWAVEFRVRAEREVSFALRLRLPWWLAGEARVCVNGERQPVESKPSSWCTLDRAWREDIVRLELPVALSTCPIPDAQDTVAFLYGPAVLAGLTDREHVLRGDKNDPTSLLEPDGELAHQSWTHGFRTRAQEPGIRFVPLYDVTDECYTVYYPVRP